MLKFKIYLKKIFILICDNFYITDLNSFGYNIFKFKNFVV